MPPLIEAADCQVDAEDDEGHCYMMDTEFKTAEGFLVAAGDLSIGAKVLDYEGNVRPVTWCRKLRKKARLLVDLHTKPFTVTGTHRIVVPGGSIMEAKSLRQNDEVLIGGGCQRLQKVTKRHGYVEVMEIEFSEDATVEVHAPSILTKGSDPSQPMNEDGSLKCKEESEDMVLDGLQVCIGENKTLTGATGSYIPEPCNGSTNAWPDTDDDMR